MLGSAVLFVGSLLSVLFLFLIPPSFFFPPGLCCMHSVQKLGLKWLAQGKSWSVSLVSRSRMALSKLAPYLYYLNFANLCSFKQNPQTGSILDQWPARIWPFVCEMMTVSFVYHAICKSEQELFLKSKECKQEICVRWKVVSWIFSLKKKNKPKTARSHPESTRLDFWHSLQKMLRPCSYFPLMAAFTLRL